MSYDIRLIKAAKQDFLKLDGSQKELVAKALKKVAQNPLPQSEGGYGKPLGNHATTSLAGLLKIKLKKSGIRIVYKLIQQQGQMVVIVIGMRADSAVYKTAQQRLKML